VTIQLNATGDTVWTIYGIDTPTRVGKDGSIVAQDSYDDEPVGPITANTYEVIGWGYDSCGVPFAVWYETPLPNSTIPIFDIVSRSDQGPSDLTLKSIFEAVTALDDPVVSDLASKSKKLIQNGARDGLPFPTCNASCQTNENLPF